MSEWVERARAHILVVDDDAATLAAVRGLLEDEGYRVTCAPDAPAALERAEHDRPDLILLDLGMPIMDGRAFAVHYQQTPGPHAPIVLLSAKQHLIDDVERTSAAGFVRKPFRMEELLGVIQRFTSARARAHEQLRETKGEMADDGERPAAGREQGTGGTGASQPGGSGRKRAREEVARQQRLRYLQGLQAQVAELRQQLSSVNLQTRALLELQQTRSLTVEEAQLGRSLTRESERLRYELQRLFSEFEQLRGSPPAGRSS